MTQVVSFRGYTPAARFDSIAWTQARVEEGSSSEGPWTLIDTLTLATVDSDPANPATRSLTTANASDTPGLWYRLTFIDDFGGVGKPSAPIQNTEPVSAAFATTDELATRLGEAIPDDQLGRAETLLELASDIIRDEVKQKIGLLTDVFELPGTTDESIELPEHPVDSIGQVLLGSNELVEGTDWYLDGNKIVRMPITRVVILEGQLDESSMTPLGTAGFGFPNQTVRITYTHGYAEIPGVVKAMCLEMVVRVWINPGSIARESVGDTSTVYDNNRFSPSGLQLTDNEQQVLKRRFGISANSVTIGR